MTRMISTAVVTIALGTTVLATVVQAQRPIGPPVSPRTYPFSPGPTLSPYLEYFRTPLGPLDSYHEFVRPRVQLQQRLRQQDAQLRRQAQDLRVLDQRMVAPQRPSDASPTGTGATFFHHSHFYPALR